MFANFYYTFFELEEIGSDLFIQNAGLKMGLDKEKRRFILDIAQWKMAA